MKLLNY